MVNRPPCRIRQDCPPLLYIHAPVRWAEYENATTIEPRGHWEFKAAYKDEFGEELSDDEVREIAMRLLRFFGILSKDK